MSGQEEKPEDVRAAYRAKYYGSVSTSDPHLQSLKQKHAQLNKRLAQLREEELASERQKKSLTNMVELSLDAEGVLMRKCAADKEEAVTGESENGGSTEKGDVDKESEEKAGEVDGDKVPDDLLPQLTDEEQATLKRLKEVDSNSLTEQLAELDERLSDLKAEKDRVERQIKLVDVELKTKENRMRHTPEELIQMELAKARAGQ